MPDDDRKLITITLPEDFAERAAEVRERTARGELTEPDQLAAALGLPVEFVKASLAITMALQSGHAVLVVPGTAPNEVIH